MFLAAVSAFLLPGGVQFRGIGTIRGPWVLVLSGLYIAISIGLLKRSPWARLATIAVAALGIAFLGVSLVSGLLQARPIFVLANLLRFPIDGLIVWYLLEPEVCRAFARPEG
jgi:hypothetical protein